MLKLRSFPWERSAETRRNNHGCIVETLSLIRVSLHIVKRGRRLLLAVLVRFTEPHLRKYNICGFSWLLSFFVRVGTITGTFKSGAIHHFVFIFFSKMSYIYKMSYIFKMSYIYIFFVNLCEIVFTEAFYVFFLGVIPFANSSSFVQRGITLRPLRKCKSFLPSAFVDERSLKLIFYY